MFFSTKIAPEFQTCYATERPYTDMAQNNHLSQESIFLPTVLADLTQLVDYFTKGNFEEKRSYISPEKEAAIHLALRELCQNKGIIGAESKWDSYVDQQLKLLEAHYTSQSDPTVLLDLAYKQLNHGGDIIKKVMYTESEAAESEQTLFWRVSSRGHESDIEMCKVKEKKISFGDSLFSGYIWDGIMHSNIEVSHSNYSACVFSYYDTHNQGRAKWAEVQADGYVTTGQHYKVKVKFENLSDSFQNYLKHLNNHELYAVKFNNEELQNKMHENVSIPTSTISSASCYQAGEEFHPKVQLQGDEVISTFHLIDFA